MSLALPIEWFDAEFGNLPARAEICISVPHARPPDEDVKQCISRPSPEPARQPARSRRATLLFSLPALLVVCGLLAGTAQAPVAKAVATADTQDLSPTERQRRVSKLVSNVIERSHYRQSPINDPVSALVLDRFIEQLDGGAQLLPRQRHRRVRALPLPARRRRRRRPARAGVRDLQPLPGAQPRARRATRCSC